VVAAPGAGFRRRYPAAAAALAATLALALAVPGCGTGRRAQPRTAAAPQDIRSTLVRKAATELCTAENAQEMGVNRLGRLYDARPAQFLAVQRAESAARHRLRDALAALAATGVDRTTLGRLLEDEDAVLDARSRLLDAVGKQPATGKLAPMTGPPSLARAYRDVVTAYVAAGRDFLTAGLAACATPLITVLAGPGQDEASAATVEFRIAAACHRVAYTARSARPAESFPGTATLGTVVQPGTHKPNDAYDGSSGPVSPKVGADEAIVLTSSHYPVDSATCVPPEPSPAPGAS
jgi:hypothetical protein